MNRATKDSFLNIFPLLVMLVIVAGSVLACTATIIAENPSSYEWCAPVQESLCSAGWCRVKVNGEYFDTGLRLPGEIVCKRGRRLEAAPRGEK